MKAIVQLGIAVILLLCLLDMPYGYYQFVRIACFLGFINLTYRELKEERTFLAVLLIAFIALFNPIYIISFTKRVWNTIDLILAGLLILYTTAQWFFSRYKITKQF